MPVIKGEHAETSVNGAIVLDLADIGRQAEQLRAAARHKATTIIQQAEQRAAQIAAKAHDEALMSGRSEGIQKGRVEGSEQGRQEAIEAARSQFESLHQSWFEAIREWDKNRQDIEQQASKAILAFALRFAERVVHRVVQIDTTVVIDQLAAALAQVLSHTVVTVKIHPDDRPVLEQAMPQLSAQFAHFKGIHLVDDKRIGRGGCILCYGQGRIDATVDTQLNRLAKVIAPNAANLMSVADP